MRLLAFNRSSAMLLLAVAAGACAAWAARQYLQDRAQLIEARAKVPMTQRIVAAHDLPAGTRLEPEHLVIRSYPLALVSSDSLPPERYTELTGTVLRTPLRAGDPVLPVHAAAHQPGAFSSHLASGRRAITMPVDAINSVSGLLQPGDLIDLYVSFEYQRRRITAPLLQGVLVLATGASTQYTPDASSSRAAPYATVTLDAAPEDAVKLVAARQSGTITAVLRSPHDADSTQKAVRGDLASLLGVNRPPPAASKKVPVLYGSQALRNVPRLAPAKTLAQAAGVFDLPYAPELVSAWLRAPAPGTVSDAPFHRGSADTDQTLVGMASE
ncbi:MAG: Flp pilus assembly protein CpaB [Burkholderiaceae bacterium]